MSITNKKKSKCASHKQFIQLAVSSYIILAQHMMLIICSQICSKVLNDSQRVSL